MNKDTQSWSNSNLTEMEELLQKMQQLERENAALREKAERYRLVTLRQDADNTALCNRLAALENQTQWECSCGGTDCEGQKENAVLRADAERYRYIKNSETMEVSEILQSFCVSITFDLDAAIDAARAKEAKP
jgi:predicted nuclease with TOPRIM domain